MIASWYKETRSGARNLPRISKERMEPLALGLSLFVGTARVHRPRTRDSGGRQRAPRAYVLFEYAHAKPENETLFSIGKTAMAVTLRTEWACFQRVTVISIRGIDLAL